MEHVKTILPPVVIFLFFSNFCVNKIGAIVLISSTFSRFPRFINCVGRISVMPALLTRPYKAGTCSTSLSICSSLVKSATIARCPSPSRAFKVSCNRASLRPVTTSFAPILEHSMAVERPIPEDAPVTRIILSAIEKGLYITS